MFIMLFICSFCTIHTRGICVVSFSDSILRLASLIIDLLNGIALKCFLGHYRLNYACQLQKRIPIQLQDIITVTNYIFNLYYLRKHSIEYP